MSARVSAVRARSRQEADPTLLARSGNSCQRPWRLSGLGALLRRKGATKMGRQSKWSIANRCCFFPVQNEFDLTGMT